MDTESQYILDRMRLHERLEQNPKLSDAQLAQEIGRSKRWVQKWRSRVLNSKIKDFSKYMSVSRAPKTSQKKVHPDVEKIIVDLREELSEKYHRKAGPIVIINELRKREDLRDEGYYLPTSVTTVTRILKNHGYIFPKRPRFRIPVVFILKDVKATMPKLLWKQSPVYLSLVVYPNGFAWIVIRALWEQNQQTTPTSHSSLHEVTVTHPFHPLRGQQVQVLCVYQRSPEPDLYIQASDGTAMCIAMSLTDYADGTHEHDPQQFLTWSGLLNIAKFIEKKQCSSG